MAGGGVLLTVHVAPAHEGRLIAFVLDPPGPRGRWLPWTVLPQGGNPYEIAATLVDEWCDGAVSDLRLADVISGEGEEGWELAIVFRAELTALPRGERGAPHPHAPEDLAGIRRFPPTDLARWLAAPPPAAPPPAATADSPPAVF